MKMLIALSLLIGLSAQAAEFSISVNHVGQIIASSLPVCPPGTLTANGQMVSKSTYAKLYAGIGEAYGPNPGNDNFVLPNYSGQFLRGADETGVFSVDGPRVVGSSQGQATAKNGIQFIDPGHTHLQGDASVNPSVSYGWGYAPFGNLNQQSGNINYYHPYVSTSTTNAYLTAGDTETRPTNVAVKYCIAY